MKAMGITRYGAPLEPIELPRTKVGAGEVTIAVEYCGVCGTDVKIVDGTLPFSAGLGLPHVPGHEVVGTVVDSDSAFSPAVGTRVVLYDYGTCGSCRSCLAGRETTCARLSRRIGFTDPGGFQEQLTVPASMAIPLPASIDPQAAAAISCAIGTAYRATVKLGRIVPGSTVAVFGAGGVGIHAIQIACAAGATVLAVEPSASRRDAALIAGASQVVSVTEVEELRSAEVDLVVETSGSPDLSAAIDVAAPGGRVVLVGYAPGIRSGFDAQAAVLKEISLVGSRYATRTDLSNAIALIAAGRIKPVVSEVYPLSDANLAIAAVRSGIPLGRVAVAVS
jgi:2-desacetyl-2-hydroxyethyl bacteriochlorophyllide A dehydrogenase